MPRFFFTMRFIIPVLLLFPVMAFTQALPRDGAVINYRMALFRDNNACQKKNCYIEIAQGNYQARPSFEQHIIIRSRVTQSGTQVTLPLFNTEYTWRIIHSKKEKTPELHHFKTGYSKFADTNFYRMRITNRNRDSNIYIFNDYLRTLSDLNGNIIWYLPDIPGVIDENTLIRDLKMTPQGTITFLTGNGAYETDFNGKILWKAPDDGQVSHAATENYHHEFTRLHNGNYMASGMETIEKINPGTLQKQYVQYETLIEYNSQEKTLWSWRASEHIPDSIVFSKHLPDGTCNTSMHLNAFYFDTASKVIYCSFRDLSCIMKIQYPSGQVLNIYKGIYNYEKPPIFKSQHNCSINRDGNLMLYNNNNPQKFEKQEKASNIISTIEILNINNNQPERLWEFNCNIDTEALPYTNSGGSVYELKNGSLLASMGSTNRNFIVTKRKEITWNEITEKRDGDGRWVPAGTYRISCIEPAALKALLSNVH